MQHYLQDFSEEIVIIGGDFNCSLSDEHKKGDNPITKKASVNKEIEHIRSCNNLIDIWRQLNPQLEFFTWRNKSYEIQCRLDFFLISEKVADLVTSCKTFHAPETDHSEISLHLQVKIKQQNWDPGFWKFNDSLLRDEAFVNELRTNVNLYKAKYQTKLYGIIKKNIQLTNWQCFW